MSDVRRCNPIPAVKLTENLRFVLLLFCCTVFASPAGAQGQTTLTPAYISREEFRTRNGASQETGSLDFLEPELHKRVKLFLGVSLPMGEFASTSISSEKSGFAQIGFGGGVEYTHELTTGLGFIVTGMINGYGQDVSDWKKNYPWFTFDGETLVDYWLLGGLFFDKDFSTKVTAYGFFELGMLYADFPNLTALDAFDGKLTITAPAAFTLGYSVGVGMSVDHYDFSFKYLSGNPEYTPTGQLGSQKVTYNAVHKPVSAIQFTLGYIVN